MWKTNENADFRKLTFEVYLLVLLCFRLAGVFERLNYYHAMKD
jgi:hypothetical protein